VNREVPPRERRNRIMHIMQKKTQRDDVREHPVKIRYRTQGHRGNTPFMFQILKSCYRRTLHGVQLTLEMLRFESKGSNHCKTVVASMREMHPLESSPAAVSNR